MQMKKTKNKGKIKSIITFIVIAIILLLLAFSEDIMKLANKNQINLAQNVENSTGSGEPNVPTISAGMIPVKWDGTNWVITTKKDTNWYDYENGSPAYIMLNDGVYQSELIRDMTNKKLAEENIGEQIQENELGTIFMWIPKFAYNGDEQIQYIKAETELGGDWTTPEMFMYSTNNETAPDYLLSGIWVEEKVDSSYSSKMNEMNKEEGIYGFLANTKAVQINATDTGILQKYVGNDAPVVPLNDVTNLNRIMLKIIDTNKQELIKAKIQHNEIAETITITVTYTKYGIAKIVDDEGKEVTYTSENGIITAVVNEKEGINTFTITDKKGNKKELQITVPPKGIYVKLYTDGTLVFAKNDRQVSGKILETSYGDIINNECKSSADILWYNDKEKIKKVDIIDPIRPKETALWFWGCTNLTNIAHINNLNTSNVTNMRGMFYGCSKLNTLDVSQFDTHNVTNMMLMFNGCSKLTKLDLNGWNTENVIYMMNMFDGCSSLTTLDVSQFDTHNVTYMTSMFYDCSELTLLDLSSWNTENVTDMRYMFYGCSGLTSLDLNTWNTENVTDMGYMFYGCSGLNTLDVSRFNTSNVKNMDDMFRDCSGLTSLLLSNFDTTSVTDMKHMFLGCSRLTTLDLTSFDTRNVTDMTSMFAFDSELKTIYVSRATWKVPSGNNLFNQTGTSSVTYR